MNKSVECRFVCIYLIFAFKVVFGLLLSFKTTLYFQAIVIQELCQ